ncbi:MAG: hypothetical protein HYS08_02100 [Chlamydiae bacterium]|nr:hypothetical protein [Chlamydiota bacterium]MBI3266667.1 hypothetical protein [Chlamydiota bacterium]
MIKKGVSYFSNRYLSHFKEDLVEIQSFPFHYILHTFSENDLAYYRGTLQKMIALSKEAGLQVYVDPWGVGGVFGGEAFSRFVAQHPEECQVLSSGRRLAAACPARPRFLDFMKGWLEAVSQLKSDVVFWDEPHFYFENNLTSRNSSEDWACCCDFCRHEFKKQWGHEMGPELTAEILTFREECLISFLRSLCSRAHQLGFKNAVCLVPKFEKILGIEHWEKVASLPEVDILSADPYAILLNVQVRDFVREITQRVTGLAQKFGKESEIWVQAFRIPKGREEEVTWAIQEASSGKPSRLAVWSHRGTEAMSELSCDRPELVWEKVREGFHGR